MSRTTTETTTAPLLAPRQSAGNSTPARGSRTTTTFASLLGRFAGRRGASMLVRETAARQLEQRRTDWGYSFPAIALDIVWSFAFVVFTVFMLLWTAPEKPNVPLRVWICGYALQCVWHTVLVCLEYRRRNRRVAEDETRTGSSSNIENTEDADRRVGDSRSSNGSSDDNGCDNLVTFLSCMWWILGFYWVFSAEEYLLQHAPRLYWLTWGYLALDVFIAFFFFLVACLVGIAACCCLPCIIAFLYIIAGQNGASEADISMLPKFRFEVSSDKEQLGIGGGRMVPIRTTGQDLFTGRVLQEDDADCCICLCTYENGIKLLLLPCNHHFHATCIEKWLKINATCPLCKYNIKQNNQGLNFLLKNTFIDDLTLFYSNLCMILPPPTLPLSTFSICKTYVFASEIVHLQSIR